ncbi:glycosyltransferase family 2 protein [Xanthomarina sp. F2636L]|uniref:glycosyltransferase family 2 protein n=1 Tax=Xanthomarina sp. F2636L TaxID=2996018 RepID=UPI00225E43E4|nr:glycosyltransferase family A protein [Xanthomarina sp. F2636L]MCX7550553.1 glycosyltransferase family A protein [Xanthomarina sp. F2636L]
MNISEKTKIPLEILVATTNRNSLDFINNMFKNNVLENYQVLIINQTSENMLLESDKPNIRVINSFETGLSRSRNLAIQHAIGDICLLSDDDVIYLKNFEKQILKSYKELPGAGVITFKTLTPNNKPYSKYPEKIIGLESFYRKVLSIEISFKKEIIIENKLFFDENFGLGSVFQDCENRLFLEEVLKNKQINAYFSPEFIVVHEPLSSSDDVTSDRYMFARSALFYKYHGVLGWIYVCKLIFSLVNRKYIKLNNVPHKLKVAKQSINTYKSMVHGE